MSPPFVISFTCPRKDSAIDSINKIEVLLHRKCYPVVSTNTLALNSVNDVKFVMVNNVHTHTKFMRKLETFRSRNSFIIARSAMSKSINLATNQVLCLKEMSKFASIVCIPDFGIHETY